MNKRSLFDNPSFSSSTPSSFSFQTHANNNLQSNNLFHLHQSSSYPWPETRPPSSNSILTQSPPSIQFIRPPVHQLPSNHFSQSSHLWNQAWPRQWGWTGVDIPVHALRSLRDQIELSHSIPSKFDSLHRPNDDPSLDTLDYSAGEVISCNFGNDRWKVEVVKGHTRRPSAPTTPTKLSHPSPTIGRTLNGAIRPVTPPRLRTTEDQHHKLSLYLTCNEIDWQTSPRSISTSIFVAIKEPRIPLHSHPITDLGSSHEGWIWKTSAGLHTFEKEKEVWECTSFPSLSSLLMNPRVNTFDSFVLSIQIGTPASVFMPQIPLASLIPNSVLESLESLLDDPNTSDLQIIVTEVSEDGGNNVIEMASEASEGGSQQGSRQGTSKKTKTQFRKRVLYAHSTILKHRSEYFKTMLADELNGGGWAESAPRPSASTHHLSNSELPNQSFLPVERKLGLIKIEDFDFVSVYWLLRWLYSNRIFFEEHEDVRAQCHIGAVLASSESSLDPARIKSNGNNNDSKRNSYNKPNFTMSELKSLWNWQTYPINPFAGDQSHIAEGGENEHIPDQAYMSPPLGKQAKSTSIGTQTSNITTPPSSITQPEGSTNTCFSLPNQPPFIALRDRTSPPPSTPTGLNQPDPMSLHSSNWLLGDPHSHPVEMKQKASAFAIYRLAHRYELKTLQDLALTHLISNLHPASAFPMLLASFIFPELHAQVKAYCLANYFDILREPEFSRCYAEVGDGLWEHGGEVLLSFTMSLRPGS